MQVASSNRDSPEKSEIHLLPLIDLNPSNNTCIYSTLRFVEEQASRLRVQTPCVTFDQPLWIKTVNIIKNKGLKIVCRLGGFHLPMSFFGSICTFMQGSGLEDVLSEVYAQKCCTSYDDWQSVFKIIEGTLPGRHRIEITKRRIPKVF